MVRYACFGNWVSLFRQTSCDFRAVLLATIVNKDSLLHVVWIHHPEKHKPWWTLWKGDSSRVYEHLKGKSNTSIVPRTYQTIRTFWYWFGALQKRAYFANGRTSGTSIQRLRKRAFDSYGYGRMVGTETGVRTSIQGKLYCDTYRIITLLSISRGRTLWRSAPEKKRWFVCTLTFFSFCNHIVCKMKLVKCVAETWWKTPCRVITKTWSH